MSMKAELNITYTGMYRMDDIRSYSLNDDCYYKLSRRNMPL